MLLSFIFTLLSSFFGQNHTLIFACSSSAPSNAQDSVASFIWEDNHEQGDGLTSYQNHLPLTNNHEQTDVSINKELLRQCESMQSFFSCKESFLITSYKSRQYNSYKSNLSLLLKHKNDSLKVCTHINIEFVRKLPC